MLWNAARGSFVRFPGVMLCAIVGAVAAIALVETDGSEGWLKLFLSAQLGIPFMFAITLAGEARGWSATRVWVLRAIAALALAGYGVTFDQHYDVVSFTRHAQYTIGALLLVAFLPFRIQDQLNGFWQYHRSLFTRLCVAVLYSAVLCGGLELALVGVDQLLGVDVPEELYFHLFATIGMVVMPWVFAGGVPRDIPALDNDTEYPKGLKVFAQYILLPIVIVYLAILMIYLGKIVVTRVWPSGWVGWMVSIVAVVGIFANLLVHPVRDREGNQWVRTYARWYYIVMLPAAVMLLLAVGKRIDQYGITENRYILAVLGMWLAGLCVYFIVRTSRNIKVIPITLCIIAFATSFGPWGAYSVSHNSQLERLEEMLERNDILVDGVIVPATGDVAFEDRREISAVTHYIVTTHGVDRIRPWFGDRWAEVDTAGMVSDRESRRGEQERVARVMRAMGLTHVAHWRTSGGGTEQFQYIRDGELRVYASEGADFMVRTGSYFERTPVDGSERAIGWNDSSSSFVVTADGTELELDMGAWLAGARLQLGDAFGKLTPATALVRAENERVRVVVYVEDVRWEIRDGEPRIVTIQALCYLTWLE
jgi:hypothetical protein